MRVLLRPLIACAALAAGAAAEDDEAALAVRVLSALRRGEVAPLEALPADAALAPVDLPDPAEPGLRRRWSLALPALVAGLEPAARTRALAVLARRAEAACALAGPGGALDALPSPAAL
ncbi:MAG: hypothetical protein L6R48_18675, partial [Planctomycetes bacterium]|nr:hypothetical protein [Planctomycetota bacterium]